MSTAPRSVAEMVDRQVRKWEAESQQRERQHLPIISVSREYGSGGAELARAVARRAGFDIWDQELVHAMAEESGVADRFVETLDEHTRGALSYVFQTPLASERFSEEQYRSQLIKVLKTISEYGAAVVVGRGANFVLGPKHALRVRVVGAIEQRIRRVVKRKGLTEDEARTEIERVDRERAKFNSRHFLREVAEPTAYDLTVNAFSFSKPQLVDVILAAYQAKFGIAADASAV